MRTNAVLTAIGINILALMVTSFLTVDQLLPIKLLPIIGFCLLWANYVFFRTTVLRRSDNGRAIPLWRFSGLLGTAGVYFAGALWGIILFARDREWYGILGASIAVGVGVFCLVTSRRLQERHLKETA